MIQTKWNKLNISSWIFLVIFVFILTACGSKGGGSASKESGEDENINTDISDNKNDDSGKNTDTVDSSGSTAKWKITTFDNSGIEIDDQSMAVDSNNKIHMSFYDKTDKSLKYVSNTTGEWVITVIDKDKAGLDNSIVVDSDKHIHLVYYVSSDYLKSGRSLTYATNASGEWVITNIRKNIYGSTYKPALMIDDNKKLHIGYFDGEEVKYLTNTSGTWADNTIGSINDIDYSIGNIAIDSNLKVHMVYQSGSVIEGDTDTPIKYGTNASGKWVTTTVDNNGYYPSLAIDTQNKVHVVFSYMDLYDSNDPSGLKYATNASGTWNNTTVDNSSIKPLSFFFKPVISIDLNGKAHIGYIVNSRILKYVSNVSGPWTMSLIEQIPENGGSFDIFSSSSLKVDSGSKAHISYITNSSDSRSETLKYATNQ